VKKVCAHWWGLNCHACAWYIAENEEKAACHLWCALEGRRYIPNLAKKLKESQEGAFVLQLDFPWYFLGSAAPG
jgi:hypothetical protein